MDQVTTLLTPAAFKCEIFSFGFDIAGCIHRSRPYDCGNVELGFKILSKSLELRHTCIFDGLYSTSLTSLFPGLFMNREATRTRGPLNGSNRLLDLAIDCFPFIAF